MRSYSLQRDHIRHFFDLYSIESHRPRLSAIQSLHLRLCITDVADDGDLRPFKVDQIKYFADYKKILQSNDLVDDKIPISYVLLTFNFHHEHAGNEVAQLLPFKRWLCRYWNRGHIYEVVCVTVNIFQRFMNMMASTHPDALSMKNTVRFLRLTNRSAPQPTHDENRLCNALTLIHQHVADTKNVNVNIDALPKIYGLSIGFHVKDDGSVAYVQQNFAPYRQYLRNLRLLILHGCHMKRYSNQAVENDLLDGVLDAVNDNIVYLDLSFMLSRKRTTGIAQAQEQGGAAYMYSMRFPESVQVINFGYDFETYSERKISVANTAQLQRLKLIYIEMNPKRIQIEFIAQFIRSCPSLQCVAVNLGGIVWDYFMQQMQRNQKIEAMKKSWRSAVQPAQKRDRKLDVVVVTTHNGVHSSLKKIMNDTFGVDDDEKDSSGEALVNLTYVHGKSGIEWLFKYVSQNISTGDAHFKKLWNLYHFGRNNFSSLDVRFQ